LKASAGVTNVVQTFRPAIGSETFPRAAVLLPFPRNGRST
jgi:hypothetical protein